MTITNWEDAKINIKAQSPAFLLTVGFIFFICTVIVFWNAMVDYQTQRETTQLDYYKCYSKRYRNKSAGFKRAKLWI